MTNNRNRRLTKSERKNITVVRRDAKHYDDRESFKNLRSLKRVK